MSNEVKVKSWSARAIERRNYGGNVSIMTVLLPFFAQLLLPSFLFYTQTNHNKLDAVSLDNGKVNTEQRFAISKIKMLIFQASQPIGILYIHSTSIGWKLVSIQTYFFSDHVLVQNLEWSGSTYFCKNDLKWDQSCAAALA